MFYSVTGNIICSDESSVALDCSGVGFRCLTTFNTLRKLGPAGSKVTLYTYLNVREDALELFGFYDITELDCFKLLISVSGVGPKAALAILSELTPDRLALCIASGDVKSVTRAQGVGPKIAQRVILELKDKITSSAFAGVSGEDILAAGAAMEVGNSAEAVSALVALGYSQSDASAVIGRLDPSLNVEELVRQGLRAVAKNNL
ncbi:MAG: Holliday junction branch migration protein RuvA [Clostridiales bacterium]|nr:Holliday junction branch migration protein RuvA [Clostridiales bacterium]